ncbi:TonB-dependent receptor [Microvirga sp. SRT01]|uniref:TonB-dependent receptor n=1 Tax=Sphingomonas longa TaxID=2778730 RepID=A0ABS2D5N5_9SPHN|nr:MULTISPECIES: TonB-dependent receptor [Alphaproteobacteria]MBM6576225.1 TonB-dependent receptor [Sphingomonas sp. BT552]MBR7709271.1 TonB-dependent receptor [Microvirga sp. SRT01]
MATPVAAQEVPPSTSTESSAEIVIEGKRLDDRSIVGTTQPLAVFDATALQGLGTTSLADMLKKLQSLTRSPSGEPPILLLNGRRISGFEEMQDLPSEAVEKFEILSEADATRFGYPPTRRVANIITKRRFRSLELEQQSNSTTEGGGTGILARAAATRLDGPRRLTLGARGERRLAITEAQRDLDPLPGLTPRSIAAASRTIRGNGAWAVPLGRTTSLSLSGSTERQADLSLLGVAIGSADAARQRSVISTTTGGIAVNGSLGEWTWNGTGSATSLAATIATLGGEPAQALRTRSATRTLSTKLVANGPLVTLPAGDATLALALDRDESRSRRAGASAADARTFNRRTSAATVTASLPIASARLGVLSMLGDVTATATGGIGHVTGGGTYPRVAATLGWQPIAAVRLGGSVDRRQTPPSVNQLFDPVRSFPNVPYFDNLTGQTVLVDVIGGGNARLAPERQRRSAIDLTLKPFAKRELTLAVTYATTDIIDQAAYVSQPTPLVAAAFPTLFTRDANGRLLSVDSRPVNLARERRRELTANLGWAGPLGAQPMLPMPPPPGTEPGPPPAMPSEPFFLFANVSPTLRLANRLMLVDGQPSLDLLDGDAFGGSGGRPRFEGNAFAALSRGGISGTFDLQWRSATRVRADLAAADLRFGSLLTIGTSLIVPLAKITGGQHWGKGVQIALNARNLFNERQRVRDRDGITPIGLRPAYLDPFGRSVMVSLRSLF